MERFIKYAAIIIVVVIIKGYFDKTDSSGSDGLTSQTYRTPTIYNIPPKPITATSAAKPLPKLEMPEMPELPTLEMPKITPPVAHNIDSLKAEIEATRFRLPELKISQTTE